MNVVLTVRYSTDFDDDGTGFPTVNDSIHALLTNTLPYMVDNVDIHFEVTD